MAVRRFNWVRQSRVDFLQAAQKIKPELGEELRRYGLPSEGNDRRKVIGEWQGRFDLPEEWVGECAWSTLAMWDRHPEYRDKLVWFGTPPSPNLAEIERPIFQYTVERPFDAQLGFEWFKRTAHSALEEALEAFGERHSVDTESERHPRDLGRALECLALMRCKQLSIEQIRKLPGHARDRTAVWREIRAAARFLGLHLPSRGQPRGKRTH
jgi:hypothetical protein